MNLFRLYRKLRASDDFRERDRLLMKLQGKSAFTEDDINEVFSCKRMGYHSNTGAVKLTMRAFGVQDLGDKIRLLRRLNGVGIVAASALLMFQNPFKYAELNHKTWAQLKRKHGFTGSEKDHKSEFGVGEYRDYLDVLSSLAAEYGMTVAEVEFVLSNMG
jgi:hypothetical protein